MELGKVCKKHGKLTHADLANNGKCKLCVKGYYTKYRENNKEDCRERNRKNRLKRGNTEISSKNCKHHGVIAKEFIDKWHRCILCRRQQNTKSHRNKRIKDPDHFKIISREKYQKDPKGIRKYHREYYDKNYEKSKEQSRLREKRQRDNLGNSYVKFITARKYGFERKEIPPEIVDMERIVLKVKRKIRDDA